MFSYSSTVFLFDSAFMPQTIVIFFAAPACGKNNPLLAAPSLKCVIDEPAAVI
jgi:hypothetical protein